MRIEIVCYPLTAVRWTVFPKTGRHSDIRHTYIIPECKGEAPAAPGFKPPPGLRPWAPPVPPAERAGSEGREKVLKIDGAFAPRVLRFDSGFAAEGCGGGSAANFNGLPSR